MNHAAALVMPLLRQPDAYLEEALRSLVHQTVPADVIVVISPRTPASNLELLERYRAIGSGLRVVMRPEGAGFPGAVNAGIREVRADRFGILLADDWLDLDAVEICLGYDADIVSAGMRIYDADGRTQLFTSKAPGSMEEYSRLTSLEQRADYLRHFFLFRTAKVREVGGLDETLGDTPGIDDYDFIWTMLEGGATVALPGRSAYNCRDHPGERMTLRDPEQKTRTLERILDKHGYFEPDRAELVRRHRRWYGRTLQEVWAELVAERNRA